MTPFLGIQPGKKYRTIMVDPPWPVACKANSYNGKEGLPYQVMSITEIAALPIREIAAENCRLFLWTTNSMLPEALPMVRLWRFQYKMLYTYCKTYGLGRTPQVATEHCVIATIGQPPTPNCRGQALLNYKVVSKKSRHSHKPMEIIQEFEKFSPSPRIELFARGPRDGWEVWGDEA